MKPKHIAFCVLLAGFVYMALSGLEYGQRVVAATTIFIGSMWITESIPLVATSLLIPLIMTMTGVVKAKQALVPFFDPVIALMLGGFIMAKGVSKHDLDKAIAEKLLRFFPRTKSGILLAICAVTTFISLFLQNTVTAILMMPFGLMFAYDDMLAKAIVLAVAYSSSIGGIGTIIGTAPNAIAVGLLENAGKKVGFLEWSIYCFPLVVILCFVCWFILKTSFGIGDEHVKASVPAPAFSKHRKQVLLLFVLTILVWMTEVLPTPIAKVLNWSGHGINSGIVSLAGAIVFLAMGLVDQEDVNTMDWSTLLLLGGGIALGVSFSQVGLDTLITQGIVSFTKGNALVCISLLIIVAMVLTIVASNTATSAIISPIAISAAAAAGLNAKIATIGAVAASSLDFLLPTGTPPNAIAYSTKKITMKDMFFTGLKMLFVSGTITIFYFLGWGMLLK